MPSSASLDIRGRAHEHIIAGAWATHILVNSKLPRSLCCTDRNSMAGPQLVHGPHRRVGMIEGDCRELT